MITVDWRRGEIPATQHPCRQMLDLEGHKTLCSAPIPREVCPFTKPRTEGAINVRVIDGPCPYHGTTIVTPQDREVLMDDYEDSVRRLDLIRQLEEAGWQVSETIVWNASSDPARVLTLSRREVFQITSTRLEALERAVGWADARLSADLG